MATWDFYTHGFSGALRNALFAFLQPVRIYPGTVPQGLLRFTPSPFPLLPVRHVVPAYSGSGLAVSPYTKHLDLAVSALTWLYQPKQQAIIATRGWPPVVSSLLHTVWPAVARLNLAVSGGRRWRRGTPRRQRVRS